LGQPSGFLSCPGRVFVKSPVNHHVSEGLLQRVYPKLTANNTNSTRAFCSWISWRSFVTASAP